MNLIINSIKKVPLRYFLMFGLVILWAYLNYALKNKFFAQFFVLFFLLLIFTRKKLPALVIIPVLFILFFNTSILDGLVKIKTTTLNAATNPYVTDKNIFTANSGNEEVLEWDLLWMKSVINDLGLKDYQLSPKLAADLRISHQIVVTAWPVKLESTSTNIFIETDEISQYPGYTLYDKEKDIALVYRP